MWKPSPQSSAGRSARSSLSPPHTSPRPHQSRSPFPPPARGRCAPLPSLLLIGAQVGESPPRAYVRVRAARAHLAFELRRFWLSFTSLPAFSARCCAKGGSSAKATGGGGSPGGRHGREENQRRRRWRGGEGGAFWPRQQITWPLNPRDSRIWAPASGAGSPEPGRPLLPHPSCPHLPPGACLGAETGMIS